MIWFLDILYEDIAALDEDLKNLEAGWYFPRETTNFVRREFSKSQEILKNMH